MGSLCCCFPVKVTEDNATNGSNGFFPNFMNKCAGLFSKEEINATPASIQGQGSFTTTAVVVNEDAQLANNMSPPRPISYDNAESTHSNLQQEGQRKSSTHRDRESVNVDDCEGGSSLEEILSAKMAHGGIGYVCPSSEDEDVCPTCLEEYTPENPKKTPPCNHHFHLPCILEWMERSPACPVCGKLMILNEVL